MAAERLDAVTLSQAEDLRTATKMIRLLLSKKPQLTKEEEKKILNDYNAIKTTFNTVAGIRDGLREDLAEHADADRIFEHGDRLETDPANHSTAKGVQPESRNISAFPGFNRSSKPQECTKFIRCQWPIQEERY